MKLSLPNKPLRTLALNVSACVALAACGGGGSSDPVFIPSRASTPSATPSLGLVRNATVNFYRATDPACPENCQLLATGNTGSSGIISASIGGYSGPLVIEVVGNNSDAEYFDEESGAFEPFSANDRLRALSPVASGSFGVTLLTELAYQRAVVTDRFPLSTESVNAINQSIGDALAPELSGGILTVPALVSDTTVTSDLTNNDAGLYALKLAALARLGSGNTSPALAVLNALVSDIQDGEIDGTNDGAALVPPAPYNPATFGSDLKTAMADFATQYGDAALEDEVDNVPPTLDLTLFDPAPDDDNPGSSDLGNSSGVTGLFNNERVTVDVSDYTGPPLSVGVGYATAGEPGDTFYFNLSGITTSVNVDRACTDAGTPGLSVRFNDAQYSGAPIDGGSCTITTVELTDTLIRVTFSGTLVRTDDNEAQPASLEITQGEFQYVVETFDAEPAPQVTASFEGLTPGLLWQQGNGSEDRGWQGSWASSAMNVVDVSSNPLAVTPSGGDELVGGDLALRFPGVADSNFTANAVRSFEKRFTDDVYISTLWRVEAATVGSNTARISFGNPSVFMGVDSGYDAAVEGTRINQFTVSLGDGDAQRAYTGGAISGNTTHHVVGRLYKSDGSNVYDRFDLWVDPARNASGTPNTTATGLGGTGSLSFIDSIGFAGQFIQNPTTIDRIRFSSTWDGVFEDAVIEEPPATGTCGGNAEGTSELPAGNDLVSTCAGTHDIAFVHRDEPHTRGTVIIGEDNSVDFDSGIVLPAAEISAVYNRISCCNRIDIDYTNGDKVKLYRTDDGLLRNVHYEPSGGTAVKVSMLPQLSEGDGDASALTSSNRVASGTVNGEVKIQETVFGTTDPITGNFGVFEVRGQSHQTTIPTTIWTLIDIPAEVGTHYCQPFDSALQVTYLRVSDSGAAQSGGKDNAVGRCTVTVTDIQADQYNPDKIVGAEGKFAVELLSTGPDGTGKLVDVVTDGYFRFFPE